MNQVIAYVITGIGALWLGFEIRDLSAVFAILLVSLGSYIHGIETARRSIEKELLQLLEEFDDER